MTASISDIVKRLKVILNQRGVPSQDADDCIQEAFQRLETYRKKHEVSHMEGFLVRTTVNIAIDKARKRKQGRLAHEPVENFTIADTAPQPDDVYASRRRLERLSEGFATLDPVTAKMLHNRRIEGLTVQAIAAIHGVSVSTVEKRLAKGLLFLVNWMDGW